MSHRFLRGGAIAFIDAEAPDVVVTDLHMSGIDGMAVARHAQGQRPPIPVVLMMACATREAERQAHSRAERSTSLSHLPVRIW